MVIFIMAFIIPSFSNFNDANINNSAGIAWITKAGDGSGSGFSQRYGKNLQIRLLVEDNGVF
jgi:hypothetical protein